MDRTTTQCELPGVVMEAYNLLQQKSIVTITEVIHENLAEDATGWVFEYVAEVPYPNQENIPKEVTFRVLIPEEFPYKPVDIYTVCGEVNGFPHQDAETGRLCLRDEDIAPRDPTRLICYVEWAINWIKDAANGMLLKPGEPYELPDFSRKLLDSPILKKFYIIFDESPSSYEAWIPYIGDFGNVECFWGSGQQMIFAVHFHSKEGVLIKESNFTSNILKNDGKIDGKWILVPRINYKRHRPPQTYEEIETLCSRDELDFYTLLKETWTLKNSHRFGILLIGFPIPQKVGGPFTEIHWQPLLFQNLKGFRDQKPKPHLKGPARKSKQIWQRLKETGFFSLEKQLPWVRVENIARERLYIRGAHPQNIQSTHIAFFGCGALGSSVAELLARGGVRQLNLFDFDSIKFSNLCRHTLDGTSVGLNKAKMLAERLSSTNPLSTIEGHGVGIPLNLCSDEAKLLTDAEVFVDCTTSETAFDWLNKYAVEKGKRMISLFFNLRAELLTICISGKSQSCGEIFEDLKCSIEMNETSLDPDVYFHEPIEEEIIMEGAGCWHPTFPARYPHIQILAAHAVDIISHTINFKTNIGLAAVVKRHTVTQDGVLPRQLVEIVCSKVYH